MTGKQLAVYRVASRLDVPLLSLYADEGPLLARFLSFVKGCFGSKGVRR